MALLKDTIIQGRLSVRDTNIKGSLKASGDISAANAVFNNITSHNIVPAANNTYSLGTDSLRYKNLFGQNGNLSGDLVISGNLTVKGTQTISNIKIIAVEDQLIELGAGRGDTALTTPAGIYVNKYDGTNSGALVFDNTGTAYVGDVTISNGTISNGSNLEPIATRVEESSIANNSLAFWSYKNNDANSVLLNTVTGTTVGTNTISAPDYTITAKTFNGALNGTAKNAKEAEKLLNNKDAGAENSSAKTIKPIYFKDGVPKEFTINIGASNKPVYLNAGTLTECSELATKNHDHGDNYVKAKYGASPKNITIDWSGEFSNDNAPYLLGWNSDGTVIKAITRTKVAVGSAATADKAKALTTNAGSKTLPVYFSDGIPVACSTTLGVSVTGNAGSATKIAISNAGSSATYNLALLTATGTTASSPVYVTNNHLKYNTGTGDLAAKTMTVGSSKQATMSFNDTNDCIEFIFN